MSQRAGFLERHVAGLCGKAVHGWRMISHQDSVGVGLSGGKDSLSLLWLLVERRRRIPIDYQIKAFHVEMGYHSVDHQALRALCADLGVELFIRETDYGPRAHTPENREKSPCFFCAMHRRRELFEMCGEHGCRKLALAHHQDDIFETFLMNFFFAGSLATMLPVQPLFNGELTVIRPLAMVNADETRRFAEKKELPVQPPCCPSAAKGQRAKVREILEPLYRKNRKVRPSMWGALVSSGLGTLPPEPDLSPLPLPEEEFDPASG